MTEQVPGLTPELADAARDVLALVRTRLNGDREGQKAIIDPLDLERAKLLLRLTADLAGSLVRANAGDHAEEYLANFARTYLA